MSCNASATHALTKTASSQQCHFSKACPQARAVSYICLCPQQCSFIDVCSNAGFLFFGTVLRAIAAADGSPGRSQDTPSLQQSMLQPVQGLILDSAPCRLTPEISARLAHMHRLIRALSVHSFASWRFVLTCLTLCGVVKLSMWPDAYRVLLGNAHAYIYYLTIHQTVLVHNTAPFLLRLGASQQQFCPSQRSPSSGGILGLSLQHSCFSHLFCNFLLLPIGKSRSGSKLVYIYIFPAILL